MATDTSATTAQDGSTHPILLFDGVCNFCEGSVQFVIARDPKARIRFASLQSDIGTELGQRFGVDTSQVHSLLFIDRDVLYAESEAALRVAGKLKFPWNTLTVLRFIPRFIRDPVYRFVAKRRYRWFGRKEECLIPGPDTRARFLS